MKAFVELDRPHLHIFYICLLVIAWFFPSPFGALKFQVKVTTSTTTSATCNPCPVCDHALTNDAPIFTGLLLRGIYENSSNESSIIIMENMKNDEEFPKFELDEDGLRLPEYGGRSKREAPDSDTVGNSSTNTSDVSTKNTAPEDRIGLITARWATAIGGVLAVICAILILIFYCRCKARCLRQIRPASHRRAPLNNQPPLNSSLGLPRSSFGHHGAPPGSHQYMKAMEKNAEHRASELIFDL